jgi:hypothetical protein
MMVAAARNSRHVQALFPQGATAEEKPMSKILAGVAAFALLLILAMPGPANAAERRADGLRTADATMTDVSARHRRWHRRHFVRRHYWGPRYGYWGPRSYAYDPYYRPYWGPRAFVGGPGFGFSIGVGPRHWW